MHLYNGLAAAGGTLLLTAKVSPARWNSQLKDLDSRLKAAASVEIGQPDDDLLKAVLAKQFSDRQLLVDQEVISYAAKRMERSLAEVRTIVDGADKLSRERTQGYDAANPRRACHWLSRIKRVYFCADKTRVPLNFAWPQEGEKQGLSPDPIPQLFYFGMDAGTRACPGL